MAKMKRACLFRPKSLAIPATLVVNDVKCNIGSGVVLMSCCIVLVIPRPATIPRSARTDAKAVSCLVGIVLLHMSHRMCSLPDAFILCALLGAQVAGFLN